jgi:hypothetical protein
MQGDHKHMDVQDTVKATLKDALQGLKMFAINPVGGVPAFFNGLGVQRALAVGITFALFYVLSFLFGIGSLLGDVVGEANFMKLAFAAALTVASIAGASFGTRKVFRGSGSIEGDVFIAGVSLLPTAFLILLSILLGVDNIELIAVLAVIAVTYTILMVYTGCTEISGIPETAAALAVSVMILLSAWLLKVLVFASIFGV